jgi:hypothetical protein
MPIDRPVNEKLFFLKQDTAFFLHLTKELN